MLARNLQRFATCRDDVHEGRGLEQRVDQRCDGIDNMLAAIKNKKYSLFGKEKTAALRVSPVSEHDIRLHSRQLE